MRFRIAHGTNCSRPRTDMPNNVCESASERPPTIEETTAPLSPLDEPEEPSDLDDFNGPCTDDDSRWEVFIPDDDEFDPLPDPGDFWTTQDGDEEGVR